MISLEETAKLLDIKHDHWERGYRSGWLKNQSQRKYANEDWLKIEYLLDLLDKDE